jgi:hypothetical protein
VRLYKELGHRHWTRLKGYGERWSVETAYSTFKRTFGEYNVAKTLQNITKNWRPWLPSTTYSSTSKAERKGRTTKKEKRPKKKQVTPQSRIS